MHDRAGSGHAKASPARGWTHERYADRLPRVKPGRRFRAAARHPARPRHPVTRRLRQAVTAPPPGVTSALLPGATSAPALLRPLRDLAAIFRNSCHLPNERRTRVLGCG